jgi:Tfp pilus assembly protein PilF
LAPRNLDAINNRGNFLSLLGEFAQAIKSYEAIIAAPRPDDLVSPRGGKSARRRPP